MIKFEDFEVNNEKEIQHIVRGEVVPLYLKGFIYDFAPMTWAINDGSRIDELLNKVNYLLKHTVNGKRYSRFIFR